jgi:hypothetical protein
VTSFSAGEWINSETYLYGVDLFNNGYWWECHEQWEAIWKFIGSDSREGRFLQGLVQIAAACLRQFMGTDKRGWTLAVKGLERIKEFEGEIVLGVHVDKFSNLLRDRFDVQAGRTPYIELEFPSCELEVPGRLSG